VRLELSAALSLNARTLPLLTGAVAPQGVELLATALHGSEMFWRQLKFAEFDISEMSCASLMIATSHGPTNWVAIPVFTTRIFFHTGVLVRTDANINVPADLNGKRVGVPEYQQTAANWARGILKDEFGVDPRTIEWYMERPPAQSHGGSTAFKPPPGINLKYIDPATNIGNMLAGGSLDATLLYLNTANLVDRSRLGLGSRSDIRTLFPDPKAEARRYFAKTGIYPINHTVVIRRSVLEKYPWLALNLYSAFAEVKERLARQRADDLAPWLETGIVDSGLSAGLDRDPLAYGLRATRPVLETLARYVHDQGLTNRVVGLEEIFAKSCLDL
jgi:4,5-dihydroxyphthalate decarboxylase